MLNLLVVEDNLSFAKCLINSVIKSFSNLRLCKIAINGLEALEELERENIDIILLDLKMPEYNGVKLIEELEGRNLKKYYSSVIVISNEFDFIEQIKTSPFIYTYITKICGIDSIFNELNNLITSKENELLKLSFREQIINELQSINYKLTYNGTQYIIDSILLLMDMDNPFCFNLKNDVYPILAQRYNTSINNIKINITNATDNMFYDCDSKKLQQYFGLVIDHKPKPKLVITTILNKLYKNIYKG